MAVIKKKFVDIELPMIGSETSALGTVETLAGKTIRMDLTRLLKGRSLEANFKIFNQEGKLVAYPRSMKLMGSYIRRMIRKKTSYVEDSFPATCKDIQVTIKPFLITRKKISRVVRKNLRVTSRDLIIKYVKEKNYLEVCDDILMRELQKQILPKLKKIYPLSFCEIRVIETREVDKANKEASKKEPAQVDPQDQLNEGEAAEVIETKEESEETEEEEEETETQEE